jgi:hypothetical protein
MKVTYVFAGLALCILAMAYMLFKLKKDTKSLRTDLEQLYKDSGLDLKKQV